MTPPQHICPKCKQPHTASLFINEKGKPAKWCYYCRLNYRGRLTSLHQRDVTKPKREEANDATSVATREGYANHPLATLLALSHIAGAKRALAIRDGNSWRGKKAWRAYYEAKRALAHELESYQAGTQAVRPVGDVSASEGEVDVVPQAGGSPGGLLGGK